jgi:hypothetical protein
MQTALQIMQELIDRGTFETAGPNRSPWLDDLCREFGVPLGSSWCAMFVCHCFKEAARRAGQVSDFPMTAGSQSLLSSLRIKGLVSSDPNECLSWRGVLVIRTDPGGEHGHVAAVKERLTDGDGHLAAIRTCEGNTNLNGGSNGDGAYNRKRLVPLTPYAWTFCNVGGIVGGEWY